MSLKVKSSKNGQLISWVEDGVVYIRQRYFKRMKAYYAERGYKHYKVV